MNNIPVPCRAKATVATAGLLNSAFLILNLLLSRRDKAADGSDR
jgi:hypothetical protein